MFEYRYYIAPHGTHFEVVGKLAFSGQGDRYLRTGGSRKVPVLPKQGR